MLKKLTIENFTVFAKAEFEFGALNVIHGVNGSGKTHLLKVVYGLIAGIREAYEGATPGHIAQFPALVPNSHKFGRAVQAVFKCTAPDALVRKGSEQAEVAARFDKGEMVDFSVRRGSSQSSIEMTQSFLSVQEPVFVPAYNVMYLRPSFALHFNEYYTDFERVTHDVVKQLYAPRPKKLDERMRVVEAALCAETGIDVEIREDDVFVVKFAGVDAEAWMAAEGHRRLATLLTLIRNGKIATGAQLFWDEPEANLNPALLKSVARALLDLAVAGVQVFISTHSLFLMREFDILLEGQHSDVNARYFGLHPKKTGVHVMQGAKIDDAGPIAALDENLEQSERFLAAGE